MSNKSLFNTDNRAGRTSNMAGGAAYLMDARHALAQIAVTNCFNGTFYASAEKNLELAKEAAIALKGDPEFIAKVAVYARNKAYMKDMPAFLTVLLSDIDKPLFRKVFRKVVDNGKMLRNVIQMARSGAVTGKVANMSAGTWRHAIQEWFNHQSCSSIFRASIGNDPSMRDILRMSRPKPNTDEKGALFGYLLGKEISLDRLPENIRQYELFKRDKKGPVPDVDFRMLDSLGIGKIEWMEIARNAPWTMTRMNLNTFARHGVFENNSITKIVAERLRDKDQINAARVFPYQLYVAWRQINGNAAIPPEVKDALQDAMEIAIENVPVIPGNGIVCVDSSGSMSSPITGQRYGGQSSSVQCVEVAGLIASAVARKNRQAQIWTFSDHALQVDLNPRDTVTTNTSKLSSAGGGTNISAPLRDLNAKRAKADWVLYVSDYESWLDNDRSYSYMGTGLAEEWEKFKSINPQARLICCDLTPRNTSQINNEVHADVLHVGGFSDTCFDVIADFIVNGNQSNHWVEVIKKYEV